MIENKGVHMIGNLTNKGLKLFTNFSSCECKISS